MLCYHAIFAGDSGMIAEWHNENEFLGATLIEVLSNPPKKDEVVITSLVYKIKTAASKEAK